ncbi:MAG: DarT ssDNA thymidine ADP-ribosyltransferase family protein [Bacillota bacterium]
MPIPAEHAHRYVYHFSHIENLPGLLRYGFLSQNHPNFPKKHRSIAAASIQGRRAHMAVPCGPGGHVHDYVPFYFGSTSPMLLSVVNAKNVDQFDILYFELPIILAERADAVFTNASANTATPPAFYSDPADLAQLDWAAIDSLKWGNADDDFRHRRMAELLVHHQLPITSAARCVVWNDSVKDRVAQIVKGAPFPPIELESRYRRHWFVDFPNGKTSSLVQGPGEIAMNFAAACKQVEERAGEHTDTAQFKTLKRLRDALRADFGCLPHTAELVGLNSANGIHKHPVDVHTKEVVKKLLSLPEFQALDESAQILVEVAAHLHDIGKGPRSRWNGNGGLQKVDPNHPVGAMPMMVEILSEHVAKVSVASARTLMKLVCYHDLVGDVLGRGRDEQQIVDVVDDDEELNMLFALGKADATVLVEHWWDEQEAGALYNRCLKAIEEASEA